MQANKQAASTNNGPQAQPKYNPRFYEIQKYGQVHTVPLGMPLETLQQNVGMLNQLLADSITMYNLYKKHHWQVTGPTFYQLHLLLDKHANEVLETVDLIAERIQTLGGVSTGMPFDVAEMTKIERPPQGEENIPELLARTVNAHATIIKTLRDGIEQTDENKDYATNDLLSSRVLPLHELQVWFISQHLVNTPIVDDAQSNLKDTTSK
jgi:starvation-inducible DNA-binding protein